MSHETVEPYEYLEHCKDCCCARSWKALGVTTYTGMTIVEHIKQLVQQHDTLRTQARALAKVTLKDRAEACPFVDGSHGAQVWMASDIGAQKAQAVLDATKEGA